MLKISGLFALLMFLSACGTPASRDTILVQQPYWAPPADIFHPPGPVPPLIVKRIEPGMTRRDVFRRLDGYAHLMYVFHHRDGRLEDWQEVQLPQGHLDLFFGMKAGVPNQCALAARPGTCSAKPKGACVLISVDDLPRTDEDRLIRFQFTYNENWVLREGPWDEEMVASFSGPVPSSKYSK